MSMKWGRVAVAVIVGEIVPLLALAAIVAVTMPPDTADETAYATRIGAWVGPIGGSLMAFLGALWVSRKLETGHLMHGVAVGLLLAAIDLVILAVSGAPVAALALISNLSKIVFGALGGVAAGRMARLRASPSPDRADEGRKL